MTETLAAESTKRQATIGFLHRSQQHPGLQHSNVKDYRIVNIQNFKILEESPSYYVPDRDITLALHKDVASIQQQPIPYLNECAITYH